MKKEKIATYANLLTLFRLILVFPFLYFLFLENSNVWGISEFLAKIIALFLFVLASITDGLDGYFARLLNERTKLGKFFDPLVDKFLVGSALISFFLMESDLVPLWMVSLVLIREFTITFLRMYAWKMTKDVKTLFLGKAKTTFQMLTIIVILLFFILKSYYHPTGLAMISLSLSGFLKNFFEFSILQNLPYVLMWMTTILTVVSGIPYLWKNRSFYFGT